jgi:putative phage-type endonuclease
MVGTFEDGSPEWHEQRGSVIGSSDIGIILGLSKWKSAYTLYLEKRGELAPLPPSQEQQDMHDYGHHMEPFIARRFHIRNPGLTTYRTGSWVNDEHKWAGCNPDYLIGPLDNYGPENADMVLECKAASGMADWRDDGPPALYQVQLQWQLMVLGKDRGCIAAYADRGGYDEWWYDADPWAQRAYLTAAEEFTRCVDEGVPPEIDGSASTYQSLRRLNPSLERGREVEIPERIYEALTEAEKTYAAAEKDQLKWRGHALAHMGTAQFAVFDGRRVASRVAVKDNPPYLKVM